MAVTLRNLSRSLFTISLRERPNILNPTPLFIRHLVCSAETSSLSLPPSDLPPDNLPSPSLTSSLTGGSTPLFRTPSKAPLAALPFITPSFMDDPIASKFINCMMWDGKKSLVQSIFRKALEIIKVHQITEANKSSSSSEKEVTIDPLAIFHEGLQNCTPLVGTMKIRKGGKLYHIPVPLNEKRKRFLGMKWLIKAARERPGSRRVNKMPQRLAAEIIDAYNNQGSAIKQKKDLHRLAESNRAFAHFRW